MTGNNASVTRRMELLALPNFPSVEPGDDIGQLLFDSLKQADIDLQQQDVIVIAQKIISKAEGRYAYLSQVTVTEEAEKLAQSIDKDPRLVQLILDESVEVIRQRPGVVIVEHNLGYVHANAGIDRSNIDSDDANPRVLLLPKDSDKSASELKQKIATEKDLDVAIIINDSAGRAWRNGTIGFAIGTAGFEPVVNLNGQADMYGRELQVTEVAVADELAAAASFLMGQANEALPVVIIRGANLAESQSDSKSLIRARAQDMFR